MSTYCKQAGAVQGGIISPPYSVRMLRIYLRLPAMSSWLYADDTPAIATSHQASLLVRYLGTYLSELVLWVRKWRIAINVSKGPAMLFAKGGRRILKPRPFQLFREPIRWGGPCYTAHIDQVRKKAVQRRSAGTFPIQEKWTFHHECSSAVQAAYASNHGVCLPLLEVPRSLPYQETAYASV